VRSHRGKQLRLSRHPGHLSPSSLAMILPALFEPFRWRDFSLQIEENIEHK
jgi:hypothetical protein